MKMMEITHTIGASRITVAEGMQMITEAEADEPNVIRVVYRAGKVVIEYRNGSTTTLRRVNVDNDDN